MSDTSTPPTPGSDENQTDGSGAQPAPAMRVIGQYIKDLSFENPGHKAVQTQPNIDLGIDVSALPHADGNGVYEVSLKLSAKAQAESTVMFITELDYAGLFQLQGIPEDQLEPMLLIESPRLLFPFARRIIAEITREGGFPPLLIDPVDFVQLYKSQYQRAAGQAPDA